jgi:hypothetical protein
MGSPSYRGTILSISCWRHSVSCVISHVTTAVPISCSPLNLHSPKFCFSTGKEWQSLTEELRRYNHNQCLVTEINAHLLLNAFIHGNVTRSFLLNFWTSHVTVSNTKHYQAFLWSTGYSEPIITKLDFLDRFYIKGLLHNKISRRSVEKKPSFAMYTDVQT